MANNNPVILNWEGKQVVNTMVTTTAAITTNNGSMFIAVSCGELTPGTSSISDSKGNTWVQALRTTTGGSRIQIAYTTTFIGGSGHTFTYTATGNDWVAFTAIEVINCATSSVLNGTNSTVASTTTHASGTITSGSDNELWIGVGGLDSGTAGFSAPHIWPTQFIQPLGSPDGSIVAFRWVGPGVTDEFVWTGLSTVTEGSAIAGFKAAAASGGGGGTTGGAWGYA